MYLGNKVVWILIRETVAGIATNSRDGEIEFENIILYYSINCHKIYCSDVTMYDRMFFHGSQKLCR
jgi:hypothetical protein